MRTTEERTTHRPQSIVLRRDTAEAATEILRVLTTDRFERDVCCRADGSGPLETITC